MKNILRFKDIIGHDEVIERLRRDISGDRLAHAYLFVGPDGVGKATVARLLGAATLCKSESSEERPCGSCLACRKISRHNHPDFHLLEPSEGKRWIRIEQVRGLQADMSLRPFESNRRVVLVDGAENMNIAAQNAFLKTLEEPPPGTLIVMVAPGVHRLLPTIVSRCRIERFGPLKTTELANMLTDLRDIDIDEASIVASLAFGSVGAAIAMDLNFVRKVRPSLIERITEIADGEEMNPERILGLSNQLIKLGDDSLALLRGLLRDVASRKMGRSGIINSDLSETVDRLARRWRIEDILFFFDKTIESEAGLTRNLNRALVFENLLISLAEGGA